jgi:hypothetical protein
LFKKFGVKKKILKKNSHPPQLSTSFSSCLHPTLHQLHSFLFSSSKTPIVRHEKGEKNPPISFPHKKESNFASICRRSYGLLFATLLYTLIVPSHTLSLSISLHAIKKAKGEKSEKKVPKCERVE